MTTTYVRNNKVIKGPSINVNIFMSVQTIHFLRPPPPPPQNSTHQHFLSANNPNENNKNQAKKLKVYGKNVDFHRAQPPLLPIVYGLYSHENVDIYGRPLIMNLHVYTSEHSAGVNMFKNNLKTKLTSSYPRGNI